MHLMESRTSRIFERRTKESGWQFIARDEHREGVKAKRAHQFKKAFLIDRSYGVRRGVDVLENLSLEVLIFSLHRTTSNAHNFWFLPFLLAPICTEQRPTCSQSAFLRRTIVPARAATIAGLARYYFVSECRARSDRRTDDEGKLSAVKIAQFNVGCENNLKFFPAEFIIIWSMSRHAQFWWMSDNCIIGESCTSGGALNSAHGALLLIARRPTLGSASDKISNVGVFRRSDR